LRHFESLSNDEVAQLLDLTKTADSARPEITKAKAFVAGN